VRLVSLCAGGLGGLELGTERYFGAHTVAQADILPETAVVRRRHWPDSAQLVGDLREMTARDLPICDIITGGFPCQGLSTAGKMRGLEDERSALFYDVVRIFSTARPGFGVLENVPALLSKYRAVVEREFGWAGYGVTWCKIAAANVGAPHLRRRVFLLLRRGGGHGGVVSAPAVPRDLTRWPTPTAGNGNQGPGNPGSRQGGDNLVDAVAHRWATPTAKDANASGISQAFRDAGNSGTLTDQAQRWACVPDDHRLSPAWVEQLMGLPTGWTAPEGPQLHPERGPWPALRGAPQHPWEAPRTEVVGDPWRTKRLRMTGNGVVWQQAEEAIRLMWAASERAPAPSRRALFAVAG
jgi:DNA (cytosine-5)-methyltransferase 1